MIAVNDVFVPVGDSVTLDIHRHDRLSVDILAWTFNRTINIVRYNNNSRKVKLHDQYRERVEFNTETLSLTLRNLHKNDSGLYVAGELGESGLHFAKYRIPVPDPVEAPVLTALFNWSSSDSCNVTCKGHDLSLTTRYHVAPPAGVSLCLLKTVLFSVTLVLMISAVITVHIRERLIKSS
ncbi:CD48 antigen-like [Chanos chanos]|uniref:CD48 antigen-like n=1 Tax=Chanos chanos TaxID=29144 RepID=A0A6J2VC31_CHACN|nr:SLAM family member 7 [Chanos chanos]